MKKYDEDTILRELKKMEIRGNLTRRHQDIIQNIFFKWEAGVLHDTLHIWSDVIDHIIDTIGFLIENQRNFPNFIRHVEQYTLLLKIAKERLVRLYKE